MMRRGRMENDETTRQIWIAAKVEAPRGLEGEPRLTRALDYLFARAPMGYYDSMEQEILMEQYDLM